MVPISQQYNEKVCIFHFKLRFRELSIIIIQLVPIKILTLKVQYSMENKKMI